MATRTGHSRRSRDGDAEDIPRAALALARHWREVLIVLACVAAATALRLADADVAAWLFVVVVGGAVAGIVVLRARVAETRREVDELGRRDALTGVGNSRALRERLAYEVTRHGRHQRLLSVLLLDLDDFHRINDRLGHPVGDQVLRSVADALTSAVRNEDTVVRMAGDQFAVIAPDVDGDSAPLLARRIDRALANVAAGGEFLTASTGWAVYPDDGIDAEELLSSAKAAELDAKLTRRAPAPGPGAQVVQLRPQTERELP
jgi:diguanylate cyclase